MAGMKLPIPRAKCREDLPGRIGGTGNSNSPPHLIKRMEDREFNELDLRRMLQHARAYRPNIVEGRWVIEARRQGQLWEIIVEPDEREQLLVVIIAYPLAR